MNETNPIPVPNAATLPDAQTVTAVRHWTDRLFSFRCTRPRSLRFRSGEFVMIGLPGEGRPLLRAYSLASPAYADELEFLSIKVQDGPLTSKLQKIEPGDQITRPWYSRSASSTARFRPAVTPGPMVFILVRIDATSTPS